MSAPWAANFSINRPSTGPVSIVTPSTSCGTTSSSGVVTSNTTSTGLATVDPPCPTEMLEYPLLDESEPLQAVLETTRTHPDRRKEFPSISCIVVAVSPELTALVAAKEHLRHDYYWRMFMWIGRYGFPKQPQRKRICITDYCRWKKRQWKRYWKNFWIYASLVPAIRPYDFNWRFWFWRFSGNPMRLQ